MKKFFYIVFIFLAVGSSFAQSRRTLESRRKKLKKDIKKIEKVLSQTQRKKADVLDDLKDYNIKVKVRKKLIETIDLETSELSKEIDQNDYSIEKNKEELKVLKRDYAKMIYKSYKSKSKQSKALFIMSSKDFYQAYKRIKYINEYKKFIKNQALTIIDKTNLVEQLNDSLIKIKQKKLELKTEKEEETKKIAREKRQKERLVSKIKRNERKYRKQLQRKINEDRKIARQIKRIIAEAIRKANQKKKSSSKELVLTREEVDLKLRFEQNKGRLPSPIKNGYVTRKFGVQSHPTFKKIKINSTGIHIRCKKDDIAKSVFNGKVLVVQLLSKGRKSVFVQHGNYITTYTNLEDVYVKTGDRVKLGQKLGKVFTDKVTGKTTLQFVLSKNTKRLNPQSWIRI